jgi:hypothetical protein
MALQQWGISPGVALTPGLEILIDADTRLQFRIRTRVRTYAGSQLVLGVSLKVA